MITWISVEHEMPEYEVSLLVRTENGITQAHLYVASEFSDGIGGELLEWDQWHDEIHDDDFEDGFVTHWAKEKLDEF